MYIKSPTRDVCVREWMMRIFFDVMSMWWMNFNIQRQSIIMGNDWGGSKKEFPHLINCPNTQWSSLGECEWHKKCWYCILPLWLVRTKKRAEFCAGKRNRSGFAISSCHKPFISAHECLPRDFGMILIWCRAAHWFDTQNSSCEKLLLTDKSTLDANLTKIGFMTRDGDSGGIDFYFIKLPLIEKFF